MLYQSPLIEANPMKSTDAKALFDFVHKEYDSPTDFVKAKTGKESRKDHNAEYQLLLRMFDKSKPFSVRMWSRLESAFGINREEVLKGSSGHNTITGDNNNQASDGSTIETGSAQNLERIKFLEQEIKRLEELLASKNEIIELLKGKHN